MRSVSIALASRLSVGLLVAGLALIAPAAHADFVIDGKTYTTTSTTESVTAFFAPSDGGVTTTAFNSYVLLSVSGTGQSNGAAFNDAFYQYTNPNGAAITPVNGTASGNFKGNFYQLTYSSTAIGTNTAPADEAKNFIADATHATGAGIPVYNASHTYNFLLNTGLVTPGDLHFGVSDHQFGDNSGQYNITVTQLAAVPELSTCLGFGSFVFLGGLALLRQRKQTRKAA